MQTKFLQTRRLVLSRCLEIPWLVVPPGWPQWEPKAACAGFLLWHNAIELVLEIRGLRVKQN